MSGLILKQLENEYKMQSNFNSFEFEVLKLANNIIGEYNELLLKGKKYISSIELSRSQPYILDNYWCELRIHFSVNEDIIDILELFIYKNGIQTASKEDIEQWLKEDIDDIIKRYNKKNQ